MPPAPPVAVAEDNVEARAVSMVSKAIVLCSALSKLCIVCGFELESFSRFWGLLIEGIPCVELP